MSYLCLPRNHTALRPGQPILPSSSHPRRVLTPLNTRPLPHHSHTTPPHPRLQSSSSGSLSVALTSSTPRPPPPPSVASPGPSPSRPSSCRAWARSTHRPSRGMSWAGFWYAEEGRTSDVMMCTSLLCAVYVVMCAVMIAVYGVRCCGVLNTVSLSFSPGRKKPRLLPRLHRHPSL